MILLSEEEVALVDDEDFDELSQFNWFILRKPRYTSYAIRNVWADGKATRLLMHRAILKLGPDRYIDHRDGNGLNNVRSNLRVANHQQNAMNSRLRSDNTSGFKGVCFDRKRQKYVANITIDGKLTYLGLFFDPKEAHVAYCEAAKKYFGEFARTK